MPLNRRPVDLKNDQSVSGAKTFLDDLKVTSGTVSSSTTSGAVVVTGGVGVSGAINANSTLSAAGKITASGGVDGLTLENGGISGSNFNITGVNALTIADPGEGIVWSGGASGDIILATVDDASDNILRLTGTGAKLQVGTNDVLTTATTFGGDVSGTYDAIVVGNDTHTHDTRYYTETEIDSFVSRSYTSQTHSAVNLPVGWYTIATVASGRAIARFAIWDTNSSDHQSAIFYAAHHFGTDGSNTITVLHESRYSGSPFRYIRIKDLDTYDGAALQVYIDDASNAVNVAIVGDNVQSPGWVVKDFIADATDPGDVSTTPNSTDGTTSAWASFTEAARVDLDLISQGGMITTGPIYADGDTTQYKVLTTNDGFLPLTGGTLTGTVNFPGGSKVNGSGTLDGDFYARRDNGTTGVYYFVDGGDKYLYFNGTNYEFGGSYNVNMGGTLSATGASITNASRGLLLSGFTQTTMATATGSLGAIEIIQDTAGHDSFMTFHVSGDYALYFGLDGTTNDLSVGGWSMGANKYRILHKGNIDAWEGEVAGGNLTNARHIATSSRYNGTAATTALTRGECGHHFHQCWGGGTHTFTLNDSSWQQGDIITIAFRSGVSIQVSSTVMYVNSLAGRANADTVTASGPARVTFFKYNTLAGYWMCLV